MKVVVQRSKESYVLVNNKKVGSINSGLVLLVGFCNNDTIKDIEYCVKKVLNLRIFDDSNNIMNLSIKDVNKDILSISQFTLYGDIKKGNRPSYFNSMNSTDASILYSQFNELLRKEVKVETGIFQEEMEVHIINDGPVTIIIDSKEDI